MRAIAKRQTKRFFERLGVEVRRTSGLSTNNLHTMLAYIFNKYGVGLVLDVGANRGQYEEFLRDSLNYKHKVISIEPIKSNIDILRGKAQGNPNWTILPYAIGGENCKRDLNIMQKDEFSSFHVPSKNKFGLEGNVSSRQERVTMRRLDTALSEVLDLPRSPPIFLKMDTQGYDLEVLKGAGQTLERVVALQSEVPVLEIYEGMPDFCTCIRSLTEAGFDIAGFAPVTVKDDRVVEFDCVMINRRWASAGGGPIG